MNKGMLVKQVCTSVTLPTISNNFPCQQPHLFSVFSVTNFQCSFLILILEIETPHIRNIFFTNFQCSFLILILETGAPRYFKGTYPNSQVKIYIIWLFPQPPKKGRAHSPGKLMWHLLYLCFITLAPLA